ncbi:flagellin [Pseudodonghicola flavimaris]|uniref:Flagellin n=1 Tax=Pseudodonghicola flavimaris TaxID=3050036 RepID=A0ABT7EWJ4_9RHOB|nr:flagellin [Pseudodonghicola flavimaris]MDK3016720.1 flagellin [Pseudodonghicola flavimaris]
MSWNISRVSSLQLNTANRSYVASATKLLQTAGQELSTGVKADIFADLGASAALDLTLRAREANTQAYLTSNDILDSKLQAMLTSVDAARESADSVLQTSIVNASRGTTGVSALNEEAEAALESIIASLNISFNGDYLFSGIDSDAQPLSRWDEIDTETGTSPAQLLSGIVGSGPATLAEAEDMIARFDAFFDSANADASENFEGVFFNGTPAQAADGTPSARVTARLDADQSLEYGVQANDQGFRDILKGLAMLAVVDVSTIEDDATYKAWMEAANTALGNGVEGALGASADIGFNQQVVENASTRLGDLSLVQQTQIAAYENVDPYEAATRVENLQYQLEASYTVTAKLSQMSLLNYL